jgi:hypothetical protein
VNYLKYKISIFCTNLFLLIVGIVFGFVVVVGFFNDLCIIYIKYFIQTYLLVAEVASFSFRLSIEVLFVTIFFVDLSVVAVEKSGKSNFVTLKTLIFTGWTLHNFDLLKSFLI